MILVAGPASHTYGGSNVIWRRTPLVCVATWRRHSRVWTESLGFADEEFHQWICRTQIGCMALWHCCYGSNHWRSSFDRNLPQSAHRLCWRFLPWNGVESRTAVWIFGAVAVAPMTYWIWIEFELYGSLALALAWGAVEVLGIASENFSLSWCRQYIGGMNLFRSCCG